ncbi:MAG: hypothetical protein FJ005_00005 [Chloroflexi bacterium]|nr:hypothetical protein [Chloroflexota bacterium]
MNNDILQDKIRGLTDFSTMSLQYGSIWANHLDCLIARKDAAEHGESPMWKKVFDISKNERYIEHLPLFEQAIHLALIDFVIQNNQNLLSVVQGLISQDSQ